MAVVERPSVRPVSSGARLLLVVDIAVKVALIALLLVAVLMPDLPQFQGKAMLGRAIAFPIAALLVPAVWWLWFRDRPFPVLVDLLWTLPFLIDVVGNALDLYDTVDHWDDLNHFFNWFLVTSAASLVIRQLDLATWNRVALAVGFAVTMAVLWEFAEYVTFIHDSPELATAYTDTLGDLLMGSLGGLLAAVLVAGRRPARAGAPVTSPA
jgi:VanZ family protein